MALADAQQLSKAVGDRKGLSFNNQIKLQAGILNKYADSKEKLKGLKRSLNEELSKQVKDHICAVGNLLEATLLLSVAKNNAQMESYGKAVAAVTLAHNILLECVKCDDSSIKELSKHLLSESADLHKEYIMTNVIF